MQSTQRVGMHNRVERGGAERQRVAACRHEPHTLVETIGAGAAHPNRQALDRDITSHNLTAARCREIQRGPAPPRADVEDACPCTETEPRGDVVDLSASRVAIRSVIAVDDRTLDLHIHAPVLAPIPLTKDLATLL